jgi:hypothetical protein
MEPRSSLMRYAEPARSGSVPEPTPFARVGAQAGRGGEMPRRAVRTEADSGNQGTLEAVGAIDASLERQ